MRSEENSRCQLEVKTVSETEREPLPTIVTTDLPLRRREESSAKRACWREGAEEEKIGGGRREKASGKGSPLN